MRSLLLLLTIAFAMAGVVLCIRLVENHFTVYMGGIAEGLLCGNGGRWDCNEVAAHDSSWFIGLPLPIWGAVYFVVVAGLAVSAALLRGQDRKSVCAFGFIICFLGLAFDAYLAWIMAVQIGVFCLLCVVTYGLNLGLAISFRILDRTTDGAVAWRLLLPSPAGWLQVEPGVYYRNVTKTLLLAATVFAVVMVLNPALAALRDIKEYGNGEVSAFLAQFDDPPEIDMSKFEGQPARGPQDASLTIVLVGDFQCSLCRSLAATVERVSKEHPGRIRTIFVNSPVSFKCNPAIPEDLHPDACWLAQAGVCAEVQGRFWEYHDFLFHRLNHRAVTRQTVLSRLEDIGLNKETFQSCVDSVTARQALDADIDLCAELNLTATPSLIINGRAKRGSFFPWMLLRVVEKLLEKPTLAQGALEPAIGG